MSCSYNVLNSSCSDDEMEVDSDVTLMIQHTSRSYKIVNPDSLVPKVICEAGTFREDKFVGQCLTKPSYESMKYYLSILRKYLYKIDNILVAFEALESDGKQFLICEDVGEDLARWRVGFRVSADLKPKKPGRQLLRLWNESKQIIDGVTKGLLSIHTKHKLYHGNLLHGVTVLKSNNQGLLYNLVKNFTPRSRTHRDPPDGIVLDERKKDIKCIAFIIYKLLSPVEYPVNVTRQADRTMSENIDVILEDFWKVDGEVINIESFNLPDLSREIIPHQEYVQNHHTSRFDLLRYYGRIRLGTERLLVSEIDCRWLLKDSLFFTENEKILFVTECYNFLYRCPKVEEKLLTPFFNFTNWESMISLDENDMFNKNFRTKIDANGNLSMAGPGTETDYTAPSSIIRFARNCNSHFSANKTTNGFDVVQKRMDSELFIFSIIFRGIDSWISCPLEKKKSLEKDARSALESNASVLKQRLLDRFEVRSA